MMKKLTTNEKMQVNKTSVSKGLNPLYGRYLVAMYRGAQTTNEICNLLSSTKHTHGTMGYMTKRGWVKAYSKNNTLNYNLTAQGEELARYFNNQCEEVAK